MNSGGKAQRLSAVRVGGVAAVGAEAPIEVCAEAELHELVVSRLDQLVGVDVCGKVLVVECAFPGKE
jgi:hypothetical protein